MNKKRLFFKTAIFIWFFVFSLVFSTVVFAKPPESVKERLMDSREKRVELLEKQQQKLEQVRLNNQQRKEEIKERHASREAEIKANVVARIKQVFGNILNRFEAALARLDRISERIASRMDKLKAKGVNTTDAEAAFDAAQKEGTASAQAIANAKAQVEGIDSSLSPKDAVHAAIDAVRGAKQALFRYHKALVDTIRLLKADIKLRGGTESAD